MSHQPDLLAALLPAGAVAADIVDDDQTVPLRKEEAALVAHAGDKRRRHFVLGRHCAHLALERLGAATDVILSTSGGAPLWPDGVVGSITHTAGYAAAIAGPRRLLCGLGVDAERIGGVTEAFFPKLFAAEETEWLMAMTPDHRAQAATVLFSAKEAHHKAVSPDSPLRFRDLLVTLKEDKLSVRCVSRTQSEGAWRVTRGLALVVVSLPV